MKKLLTLLLILLMVFTLVGCNSKEETSAVQESEQQEVIEKIEEEIELVGGYVDVEDGSLTDELKDIFSKALEDLTGAKYEPVELVATQVVAGTNYKFLANGTKTTNPVTKGTYYISINEDLQGNVELLNIEVIEEKQEEVDKEKLKTYKYWVVFYDHDGNELQREALKYGTVPEYHGHEPYYDDGENWYYFDGWTNKNGKDKSFKPITGNTYFYAKFVKGGEIHHHSSGGGSNPPGPPPYVPNCNEKTTLIKVTYYKTLMSIPMGYQYIAYNYNPSSGVYEEAFAITGSSYKQIGGLDYNPNVIVGHYYHVILFGQAAETLLGECTTPGPDHGISVD